MKPTIELPSSQPLLSTHSGINAIHIGSFSCYDNLVKDYKVESLYLDPQSKNYFAEKAYSDGVPPDIRTLTWSQATKWLKAHMGSSYLEETKAEGLI